MYLLAATRTGYQNLCRLITQTKLRAPKGESVATWDDLDGHTEGLICLAGGMDGPVAQGGCRVPGVGCQDPHPTPNTQHLTPCDVETVIAHLQRLFPARLYLDLQRHLDPDEERLNRALVAVAERSGIPLVATNDVRYATADGRRLFDVLTCIRHKTTLDAAGRRLQKNAERHLKSPAEMAALFRDRPDAVRNTQRIAEQCEFTLADLGYRFPDYPLPPGETPIGYLRTLTYAGARQRYGQISDRVRRQLEHELAVIGKLDLAGYFLIVWDIVRFCREQAILAQGRGSAANSAVCYALGITAVDAVGMELLFERFLSEERGEWPDIDIDLPSGDQREKVIQYVYHRYGERGAAMTANVITYRTRSAVREVGKALGFSLEQVAILSKLLHRFEFRDDADALAKQLRAGGIDPTAPRVALLVDLAERIQHLPRHLGQHSGGMVIAAGRLDTVVPLEPASMPGRVVVQWDKDDCADLGIIKVDLLGLGMMAVLEEVIPLVREHEGVDLDLAQLPPDDPKTYDMLQRADTIGVFQVESRAQMATLPRLKPARFYDLVVEVALIRPGPIVGQMVHPYLNRRNGREPVTYAHPRSRADSQAHPRRAALPGAAAAHGDDAGGIHRRRGGGVAPGDGLQALGGTHAAHRGEAARRHGAARHPRHDGGRHRAQHHVVRAVRLPGIARRQLRAAGVRVGLPADAPSRGIHLRPAQQLAHGLLPPGDAGEGCATPRPAGVADRRDPFELALHARTGVRVLGVRCTEDQVPGVGCRASDPAPEPLAPANPLSLRLGLRYVAGLRAAAGQRIEEERVRAPFVSIADVVHRCGLRDDEVQRLAHIGAFAAFDLTRREAMWQAAAVPRGPLWAGVGGQVWGVRKTGFGDQVPGAGRRSRVIVPQLPTQHPNPDTRHLFPEM